MSQTCATGCTRPTRDVLLLCEDCRAELERALAELPALLDELSTTLTKQTKMSDGKSGNKPTKASEQPLPFNIAASAALDDLRTYLTGWVRVIHEDRGDDLPADSLRAMSRWLLWRLDALTCHEAAADIYDEIVGVVRNARRVIDRPADREFVGICRECSARLYVRPGGAIATCRECNTDHDADKVRADLWGQLQGVLMTVAEVVSWGVRLRYIDDAKRTRNLLDQWVARGRLVPHGTNAMGRRLFPFGSTVTEAMAAQASRPIRPRRADVAG